MLDQVLTRELAVDRTTGMGSALRPPLKAVQCLLPVWGYQYVRQFLDLGLPTWLAPGNLPALVDGLPTEFIILTSREDELFIRTHVAFRRLCETCPTTIHFVDHLITGNNYSTTITLAYLEAMRATGAAMTDTCFIFLVSDYIVADGSFTSLLKRMQTGISGIQVGNFQVILEDALPWLIEEVGKSPGVLSLKPRQLMRWALSHLHPATVANTVNFPFSHNNHTNRLFWRVDSQTLIGRFFLMHMIAIRPETRDFVIGSSCDYSFIPEMCPSDNIEIIPDSDEYLVIEMQPRHHESSMLKPGPQKTGALAKALSEWTTARHRKNSESTVVFHADDVPGNLGEAMAAADVFVTDVRGKLSPNPRPHRFHPYWMGAMAAFNEASGAKLSRDEWGLALGFPHPDLRGGVVSRLLFQPLRLFLFGKPPHVRQLHPWWPDYSLVIERLRTLRLKPGNKLLLLSNAPSIFTASLADGGEHVVRVRTPHLLKQSPEVYDPLTRTFDCCLIEVDETELPDATEIMDRVAPLMKDGGKVLVSALCRSPRRMQGSFKRNIGLAADSFIRPYTTDVAFNFVTSNRLRMSALSLVVRSVRALQKNAVFMTSGLMLASPAIGLATILGNRLARIVRDRPPPDPVSSVLVEMTIDQALAVDAHRYSASRALRDRRLRRGGHSETYRLPPRSTVGQAHIVDFILTGRGDEVKQVAAINGNIVKMDQAPMAEQSLSGEHTREPQYNRCLDLKNSQGLTSLGLMTNQVWEDDPRRLTFLLARYKFVSKMLSGKKFVGELGCGDAFGTRVVQQEVEKVVAYDFDPVFIDDIRSRQSARWPVEAHFHDIIERKLPNQHDGIYSLDVIEHIQTVDEHVYLTNLRDSLTDDGVLIIGSPSLESQTYASPPSKAGHVNCKSGPALKALLHNYFQNVFLFSMNDEVVHTGFAPMAHYLFAVCCQKKR